MVAIATPPAAHARLALAALRSGRHVFCEKPLATRLEDATEVLAAARATGAPRLTVDYPLRRNPLYALVGRLQQAVLGPPRQFALENLASDERLDAGHWFWDREVSGGIPVEHGVHFFDAAAWLLGSQPERVQALEAARPDGRVDTVLASARHPGGATASYAHSFARPDRAESQWTTLDWGELASGRLYGWIPVELELDIRTDGAGLAAVQALASDQRAALAVPGYRPSGAERITLELASRGQPGRWDLRLRATLGGQVGQAPRLPRERPRRPGRPPHRHHHRRPPGRHPGRRLDQPVHRPGNPGVGHHRHRHPPARPALLGRAALVGPVRGGCSGCGGTRWPGPRCA